MALGVVYTGTLDVYVLKPFSERTTTVSSLMASYAPLIAHISTLDEAAHTAA